ncbi:hypothetical protein D3C85_1912590 [compost metagenome]
MLLGSFNDHGIAAATQNVPKTLLDLVEMGFLVPDLQVNSIDFVLLDLDGSV